MALVGYARVSSAGQNLAVQLDKLQDCDKIFEEKKSGTIYDRPAFNLCMNYLREGDVLVVTRLDRLARSTLHLCSIAETLRQQNIELRVLEQNIDTSSATGRLIFNVLSAIAQFETEIRHERQMDGIAKARERGVHLGRRKKMTEKKVEEMRSRRENGALIRELMADYKISKATVYRLLDNQESI